MRKFLSFPIFLFLTLCFGCLDEINLPIEPSLEDAIVIEGSLSLGTPSIARISITRLFDFGASSLQPVNVREVLLFDEQDHSIALDEAGPGIYQVIIDQSNMFNVETGRSYRLQVTTFDGRKIITIPEPLIETPEIGAVSLALIEKDQIDEDGLIFQEKFASFNISAPIIASSEGKAARFLWSLEQTYKLTDSPNRSLADGKLCYINQAIDVANVNAVDGNQFAGTNEIIAPIYETPINYYFSEGYYLSVYQHSLSEGAYKYWNQISQVIDRDGNMFEPPAGRILSNFRNVDDGTQADNVYGYFYATQTDTVRFFVAPEDVGSPTMYCPWPANQQAPPRACPRFPCCECLQEIGSQLEKPSFWTN